MEINCYNGTSLSDAEDTARQASDLRLAGVATWSINSDTDHRPGAEEECAKNTFHFEA